MQLSFLFTKFPTTHAVYLEALYAEEAEVLVQLSPGEYLLRPAEIFLQVCLHLLSAAGRKGGREGGKKEERGGREGGRREGGRGGRREGRKEGGKENETDATEPSQYWPLTCAPEAAARGRTG